MELNINSPVSLFPLPLMTPEVLQTQPMLYDTS